MFIYVCASSVSLSLSLPLSIYIYIYTYVSDAIMHLWYITACDIKNDTIHVSCLTAVRYDIS